MILKRGPRQLAGRLLEKARLDEISQRFLLGSFVKLIGRQTQTPDEYCRDYLRSVVNSFAQINDPVEKRLEPIGYGYGI